LGVDFRRADEAGSAYELEELKSYQSARTSEMIDRAAYWAHGPATLRWTEKQLDLIKKHRTNPPRASRGLALVHVAMYDAMVSAWNTKHSYPYRVRPDRLDPSLKPAVPQSFEPTYPSEHAVMAGAASRVLAYLYPEEKAELARLEQEAALSRLWAGANYRSDVEKGLELGRAVADLVIARASADGSNSAWDGFGRLTGLGYWEPAPPAFGGPVEPVWGAVKTWLMSRGNQFRPELPPAPGSAQFRAEHLQVKQVSESLTREQRRIAYYWADGPGTVTPPGHWNVIAKELALRDALTTPRAARVFALLNAAQADAFVACWDSKYAYWSERPITAIRRLFDANWSPLIETPPFPGYVSGHSTVSGAASEVLAYAFPADAGLLRAQAHEAMMSRLYGGIHIRADNEVGLALGKKIGALAVERGRRDGSKNLLPFLAEAPSSELSVGRVLSFPNPAVGGKWPTIRVEAKGVRSAGVRIYDVAGDLVGEGEMIEESCDHAPAYAYRWDVSKAPPGIYFYAVTLRQEGDASETRTGRLAVLK
jgi:membrane-associated phospholipid phosphatase